VSGWSEETGSSLPELLVAGTLGLVALGMIAGGVLAPIAGMVRGSAPDERQIELDLAADVVARILRAARPGLDEAALVRAEAGAISVRVGDLHERGEVILELRDGALTVEWETAVDFIAAMPEGGLLVTGLDVDRSMFLFVTGQAEQDAILGDDSDPMAGATRAADVAVVTIVLHDASDTSHERNSVRTVRLRIRSPLAMERLT